MRAYHALARLAFTSCAPVCHPCCDLTGGRFSCPHTLLYRLLSMTTLTTYPTAGHMQKDRPQKLKVRPRTAIKRAPSLTAQLLIPMLTPA
jgi:hypothetical protein